MDRFGQTLMAASALAFASSGMHSAHAQATGAQTDPDQFSNMRVFTQAPYFAREGILTKEDVEGVWPFNIDRGEILCLKVDGVDLAMFENLDDVNGEPFLLSSNLFMSLMGKAIAQSGYLRKNLDPKTIGKVLANTHAAALRKCGPPYFQ